MKIRFGEERMVFERLVLLGLRTSSWVPFSLIPSVHKTGGNPRLHRGHRARTGRERARARITHADLVVELEYSPCPELAEREGSHIVGESIERCEGRTASQVHVTLNVTSSLPP